MEHASVPVRGALQIVQSGHRLGVYFHHPVTRVRLWCCYVRAPRSSSNRRQAGGRARDAICGHAVVEEIR